MRRTVKNNKLSLTAELIGGPYDGTLCLYNSGDIIYMLAKSQFSRPFSTAEPITRELIKKHIYRRVSGEKFIYEGITSS